MSPREDRTQPTNRAQAEILVDRAGALMTAADLLVEDDDSSSHSAATAVAVIAGIAAADALCAATMGRRSRGQDHRSAVRLLQEAAPDTPDLVSALSTLLDLKDQSHYGTTLVKRDDAIRAVRRAHTLLEAARAALRS